MWLLSGFEPGIQYTAVTTVLKPNCTDWNWGKWGHFTSPLSVCSVYVLIGVCIQWPHQQIQAPAGVHVMKYSRLVI